MLLDRETLLSDAQAVTATAFSTNSYDQSSQGRNLGRKDLRVFITTLVAATAAGAATVTFEVGEADDAAGTNFTALFTSPAIGKAALTAGAVPVDIPLPDTGTKRYLMVRYTVATGPLTAGTFTAALVRGSDHRRAYNDGYTNAN